MELTPRQLLYGHDDTPGIVSVQAGREGRARVWRRDRFDYLVNNAGTTLFAPFLETTEEQLDELLAIHVKATFLLSQRLVPLIADGGRIINVSSGLTRYSYPGQAAYALAKGAVDVLTRHELAAESRRRERRIFGRNARLVGIAGRVDV